MQKGGVKEEIVAHDLDANERVVFEQFNSAEQLDIHQLMSATGLTIGQLMMTLMGLELKGVIRTLPGQRYERI